MLDIISIDKSVSPILFLKKRRKEKKENKKKTKRKRNTRAA